MPWTVDPNHSRLAWSVKHYGIAIIHGYFKKFDTRVNFDGDDPTEWSVEATIDVASVESNCEQRDHHLRSPDYFDAENYPTITFRSTRVERADGRYRLIGDLTIRGVTREVAFEGHFAGEATDVQGNPRRGFTASTTVRRSDFNVGPPPEKLAPPSQDVEITFDAEVINRLTPVAAR